MRGFFAFVICAAVMLCAGCSMVSEPQDNYDASGYTNSKVEDPIPRTYDELWDCLYRRSLNWTALRKDIRANDSPRDVTYQELARSTNGLFGEDIIVAGEILQVVDNDIWFEGLVSITQNGSGAFEYFTDEIYFIVPKAFFNERILQGDKVGMLGRSAGLYTYNNVLGSPVTVPCILVADLVYP